MDGTTLAAVIVARDAEPFIARALESIAAQTRPADQVVVVDDGSRDRTAEVAAAFGVEVVTAGQGEPFARNVGLAAVETTYIAYLDADDRWPTDYLEKVAAAIDKSGAKLVVAGSEDRNERGDFVRRRRAMRATTPEELYERGGFKPSLATVEVAAARAIGGFDEHQPRSCDLDFALRLLDSGVAPKRIKVAIHYQVRDERESREKLQRIEDAREQLHQKVRGTVVSTEVADRVQDQRLLVLSRRYLKAGHPADARRLAWAARGVPGVWPTIGASFLPRPVLMRLVSVVRRVRARRHRRPVATPR